MAICLVTRAFNDEINGGQFPQWLCEKTENLAVRLRVQSICTKNIFTIIYIDITYEYQHCFAILLWKKKMNKTTNTIGKKIKSWRKRKGLTQDALSKKADIPYTTLAKIESDIVQNPSLQTITKITNGLEITLNDLVNKVL